ncbi:hypothetical protein [Clostridium botulinum]|uniref:hypothetical protein n=1 Tax=Clostridium botulinum TaxID=1491 RepID=UPI001C9A9BC1|nr:hypothetical protein [Clostridium botulinum]MBY6948928.1 hypothetical protein [Clostridium botulinum]MBY7022076.1 hypothetical protein [Clostridium botulinum]
MFRFLRTLSNELIRIFIIFIGSCIVGFAAYYSVKHGLLPKLQETITNLGK